MPLLAGCYIQKQYPQLSERIRKPVVIISNVAFVALILLTMAVKKGALKEIGWHTVAALLVLIVGSMIIGWLLGGPEKGMRRVAAANTSMRNAALCLMLAVAGLPERNVDLVVLAFMALMVAAEYALLCVSQHQGRSAMEGKVLRKKLPGIDAIVFSLSCIVG